MADTKSLLKASLTTRRARELGDAAHLAGTSMSATKQTGLARAKDRADAKSELLQSLETTPVKDIVGPLGGFVVDPEPSPTAPDILHSSAFAATSNIRDKKARPVCFVALMDVPARCAASPSSRALRVVSEAFSKLFVSAMGARRGLPSTPSAWGSSRSAAPALFAAASEGSP